MILNLRTECSYIVVPAVHQKLQWETSTKLFFAHNGRKFSVFSRDKFSTFSNGRCKFVKTFLFFFLMSEGTLHTFRGKVFIFTFAIC